MRFLLAFLLVFLTGAAEARVHYGANHTGPGHRLRGQPLVFATAGLDYNFQSGSYGALTTTRASQAYAEDSAGNYTSFAVNAPRITDKGLLVEEARTNSIRNNSMQGTASGSPGALPTNWSVTGGGGLTRTIVGIGVENGVDYIDIRFVGAGVGSTLNIFFDAVGTGGIVTTPTTTWTTGFFMKLVSGSLTNVTGVTNRIARYDSGGAALAQASTTITLTNVLTRFPFTFTNVTNTAFITPLMQVAYTVGVAVDFTIRIGWPQLELGDFTTSPIRTTTAAVTRAADVVTVTTPPVFASAYTLFAKATPVAPVAFTSNQFLLGVDSAAATDRFYLERASTTGFAFGLNTSASVGTTLVTNTVWPEATSRKFAGATAAASQAVSFNGGAVVAGAGALPVGVTQIVIGKNHAASVAGSTWVERIAIWPSTKLTDAELQAVTAP